MWVSRWHEAEKGSSSHTPADNTDQEEEENTGANPPSMRVSCLSMKIITREEVLLYLHAEEFNKVATQKCKGQSSSFAWVNTQKDLVVDKIKTGMSTEESWELDDEVCKWNERGLPEVEQRR